MMLDATTRHNVSATIVTALKANVVPWRMPWYGPAKAKPPYNVVTRRPYTGIDLLLLQLAAQQQDFRMKGWASEEEWLSLFGRPLRVGAVGTEIVSAPTPLFNAQQISSRLATTYRARSDDSEPDWAAAERVINAIGADIRHQWGTAAAYSYPPLDFIVFPMKVQFLLGPAGLAGFYESLFHELSHYSEPRLGWKADYATNELRAEIGSCVLATRLGLPNLTDLTMIQNHVRLVNNWVEAMNKDDGLIFRVAASAAEAADFLLSFSREKSAAA